MSRWSIYHESLYPFFTYAHAPTVTVDLLRSRLGGNPHGDIGLTGHRADDRPVANSKRTLVIGPFSSKKEDRTVVKSFIWSYPLDERLCQDKGEMRFRLKFRTASGRTIVSASGSFPNSKLRSEAEDTLKRVKSLISSKIPADSSGFAFQNRTIGSSGCSPFLGARPGAVSNLFCRRGEAEFAGQVGIMTVLGSS